jgi:AraC-like DNA-binding protein
MAQEEHADSASEPVVEAEIPAELTGLVSRITCYDLAGTDSGGDREIASFVVPIIFSFADPFRIAFDRPPVMDERIGSFVSGLHPGYVEIAYGGAVSCVQIDLTPLGAGLFFRRPMSDFATRLVPLEDVGDPALTDLGERLGAAGTRPKRLGIAVAFLEQRLLGQPLDSAAAFIWSAIQRSRGALRIDRLTDDLGWSRKRLAAHARDAFGLTPKRLARIARFHHAIDLANSAGRPDWAGIAVDCGYADQAHLVRDFTTFAGAAPERWRNRESEVPPKQIFNPSVGDHG